MPRSYRDLSPEEIDRMSRGELAHARRELEVERARLEERIQMLIEFAARDPETAEALRVRAWARAGRVTASLPEGGGEPILTAPEGWPAGIDPAAALRDLMDGMQAKDRENP